MKIILLMFIRNSYVSLIRYSVIQPSSAHIQSRPGETPTFRAPQCLARCNTHIPHTSVSPEPRIQSRPNRTPRPPAGFREPPCKPNWPRETPYATIVVFPAVRFTVRPGYPARAGIPLSFRGLTPTLRTLAPTVWVLPEQAHKSLWINLLSDTPLSVYPADFPSFRITLYNDSGHHSTSYSGFRVFAGRCTQQHLISNLQHVCPRWEHYARVTLSRNGCAMATRNEYLFYV